MTTGNLGTSRPTSRPFGHGSIPCLSPILEGSRGSQPHLSWQMAVSIQATLARNPKIGTSHCLLAECEMATTPSQCSGARVQAVLLYQYWLCIVLPSLLMVKCSVSIYCVNQGARPLFRPSMQRSRSHLRLCSQCASMPTQALHLELFRDGWTAFSPFHWTNRL